MTLRSLFKSQQLLFLLACSAFAFARPGRAQDLLILQDNTQIQGKVLGVSGSSVQVQDQRGTVGRPIAQIKEVRMAIIPTEFATAQRALAERKFDQTLAALKALEKYKGLPADWAQRATAMMGDVQLEKGDMAAAAAAYQDFQRLYPTAPAGVADIGLARLAIAKQDFDSAKQKIEPVTARALAEKTTPAALAYSYSQAFLIMGQIKEKEGDLTGALENYLRTVTLFPQDRAAVVTAQEKAHALRKAHPEIFVP